MSNIEELQNKIRSLETENQYLKLLLKKAGISYESSFDFIEKDLFSVTFENDSVSSSVGVTAKKIYMIRIRAQGYYIGK